MSTIVWQLRANISLLNYQSINQKETLVITPLKIKSATVKKMIVLIFLREKNYHTEHSKHAHSVKNYLGCFWSLKTTELCSFEVFPKGTCIDNAYCEFSQWVNQQKVSQLKLVLRSWKKSEQNDGWYFGVLIAIMRWTGQ